MAPKRRNTGKATAKAPPKEPTTEPAQPPPKQQKILPCEICAWPSTLTCSACKASPYCSSECQKFGWKKHKALCKIRQLPEAPPKDSYCGLCGAQDNLTTTNCCGNTCCDDYDKYKLMSFSRKSCLRNHDRYTNCGSHAAEGHTGEWQTCRQCQPSAGRLENAAWYQTNAYNFVKHPHPAAFTPKICRACKKPVKQNFHGLMTHRDGTISCSDCSGHPGGIPIGANQMSMV